MMKISLAALAILVGTSHARTIRGSQSVVGTPHVAPSEYKRELLGEWINAIDDPGFGGWYDVNAGERVEGNVLTNDLACHGCRMKVKDYNDDIRGDVRVDEDGSFRYDAPNDLTGEVSFTYEACLRDRDFDHICDSARVFIWIHPDPNKPDVNPTAINDNGYWVYEGNKLRISANGFLGNDRQGWPENQLFACERSDRDTDNDVEISEDGGFEYEAPRCYTGTDSFTYRACYKDYEDMKSNEGRVFIEVRQDPNRPRPPTANDDIGKYTVWEAVRLEVGRGDGLCANDNYIRPWVNRADRDPGFEGSLSVAKDGGFRYDSVSGKLGKFTFVYTLCEQDWDKCVDCSTATAEIEVTANPNKPGTPPTPEQNRNDFTIKVTEGERYRGNVFDYVEYDDRYTLRAVDYTTSEAFIGNLNTKSDGSFEYGNAPVGEEVFSYEVCYREWEDLCSIGSILMKTQSGSSSSSQKQGTGSLYEVHWDGSDEGDCAEVKPSITMYCGAGTDGESGELALIAGTNDNDSLCVVNDIGHINCDAQNSGVVHVECRDKSGTDANKGRRQLITSVGSSPVLCDGVSAATAFHSVGLRAWCNDTWVDQDLFSCSGTILEHTNGKQTCYAEATTTGSNAKVSDVTVVSTITENSCIVTKGTTISGSATPMLEIAGDNGDPSDVFPLKECQGDCDDDEDCGDGLVCMERDGKEVVPGCIGLGQDFDEKDFCIKAPAGSVAKEDPKELEIIGNADGKDHPFYPLLECQSDCDDDDECEGDLVCFEREGLEPVPGCTGDGAEFADKDFCIKPQS